MKVVDSRQRGVNGKGVRSFQLSPAVIALVDGLNLRGIDFRLRLHRCLACQLRRVTIEMDAGHVAAYATAGLHSKKEEPA